MIKIQIIRIHLFTFNKIKIEWSLINLQYRSHRRKTLTRKKSKKKTKKIRKIIFKKLETKILKIKRDLQALQEIQKEEEIQETKKEF